ncbi:AMP-binding protein [Celeribacter sp.]|uniref:AMP-binding protein n=1 Tax=Celeribacter sp. TaxID=1890673 RepID=UPI003A8FEF3D
MRDEAYLAPKDANFRPLTPLDFLERSVSIYSDRTAVIWRDQSWSYGEFNGIVLEFAAWLEEQGIGQGDVVSMMCSNRPEMLAAHYAVPMLGATLNSINTRLDEEAVEYILGHSKSRLVIADPLCEPVAKAAAVKVGLPCIGLAPDGRDEETGLALLGAAPALAVDMASRVTDEWHPIALNYTSGTTSLPKGAILHHRGAYLNALGNMLALGFNEQTVYLWILPMFHCNGWCHTWAVTAAGGVHVCLDQVEPTEIFRSIENAGVTHMACAPVVLYMLLNHEARNLRNPSNRVTVASGGAAPTSTLISQMDEIGFGFIHLYGMTESFGPVSLRTLDDSEEELETSQRANLLARQGSRHVTANRIRVVDDAMNSVPSDGNTIGEIVLQGNTLMAGYLGDAQATEDAFRDGVFHTGDLAVMHPDGQIEIKDRAKDIIISGGENISSLEVENVLHLHPAVALAAVVAKPHPKWGEVPCAFVEVRSGWSVEPEELRNFCRERLARFKAPREIVFTELPKTATGKIMKFELRHQTSEQGS